MAFSRLPRRILNIRPWPFVLPYPATKCQAAFLAGETMARHLERETYVGLQVGLPEIEMFGWTDTSHAAFLGLGPHSHSNAFEICLIVGGSVQWWVGHEIHQLGRGDVYVTKPDETHGGIDAVIQPCELYWLILPVPSRGPLPGLTETQTRDLMQAMAQLKRHSFPSSLALQQAFHRLHEELRDRPAFAQTSARAAFHALLVQVLRDHEAAVQNRAFSQRKPTERMRQAMQWIAEHLREDVPVSAMASAAGLSVSRFHERFLAEAGLTPADYRTHLRIRRAKEMLVQSKQTITHLAHELGFSTSQYFATVFKKIVGTTPGGYRRRIQHAAMTEKDAEKEEP